MEIRGLSAALLASLIGAGFSAQALAPHAPSSVAAPPTGHAAAETFPGSAYFTAVDDSAAPGAIEPAQPFALAGSAADRARALECLTAAVYHEAAREPDAGQRAVAQVVLNRVRHPAFPDTVCGVVYQGSERRGCQFSFACDGSLARGMPDRRYWLRAQAVAAAALAGDVFAPVGLATHYHSYAVAPAWNRSLVMTGAFGAHFFHRWKGWWGTPAAFRDVYRGHEPLPGPHAPAVEIAAPVPESARAEMAAVAPEQPVAALPESTILDKWKDSGKPLR